MVETSDAARRGQLEEERDRLRHQLEQMGHGPEGELAFDGGFADSSAVTAERGEIEALTGTLADTLQEIEDALAKLDGGAYGRCEQCGGPIGDARLEAMPAARYCMDCASPRR